MSKMNLEQDLQRFAQWRSKRQKREPIPDDLWMAAGRHIAGLGISRVASTFHLNDTKLREKAQQAGIVLPITRNRKNTRSEKLDRLPRVAVFPEGSTETKRFICDVVAISPGFFAAAGIQILSGRDLGESDTDQVGLLNQAAARLLWPTERGVGKHLMLERREGDGTSGRTTRSLEVIGIARDTRDLGMTQKPRPQVYVPLGQSSESRMNLFVSGDSPEMLVKELRGLVEARTDRSNIISCKTIADHAAVLLSPLRMVAAVAGILGALGLIVSCWGTYGLVSYLTGLRIREIGVRMALGAQKSRILFMAMSDGVRMVAVGIFIGLIGSFVSTRVLASLLYGIEPADPYTFAAASLVMMVVSILACYIPARRAANMQPCQALRDL